MLDKAKQLYQLQKKAREVQKELKETEIEAAGSGVKVIFNGAQHLISISVDQSLAAQGRKSELEQALKNVISEAMSRAQAVAADKTKGVMKELGMNIPGF